MRPRSRCYDSVFLAKDEGTSNDIGLYLALIGIVFQTEKFSLNVFDGCVLPRKFVPDSTHVDWLRKSQNVLTVITKHAYALIGPSVSTCCLLNPWKVGS